MGGRRKRHKRYTRVRDPETGTRLLAHRVLAQQQLGRPLLPGEVVHHRDGDSTNNAPDNLLVLPSQRYHAHIEYHLRRERLGMPSLFPEYFREAKRLPEGGLFDCLLAHQVKESALSPRPRYDHAGPCPPQASLLFPNEEESAEDD